MTISPRGSINCYMSVRLWEVLGGNVSIPGSRLSEWALSGINDLLEAGMIVSIDAVELPRDALGWRGTEKIGIPMLVYEPPTRDELHSITEPLQVESEEQ